jgi:hypothetical protein
LNVKQAIERVRSAEWVWSKPWVAAWTVNVISWCVSAFILDPRTWAYHAAGGFFSMELFALWDGWRRYPVKAERYQAPYPPLTYVTRYYLPRWLAYSLTGGLVGAIGVTVTVGLPPAIAAASVGGLAAWLVEHWEVTYREMPEPQ